VPIPAPNPAPYDTLETITTLTRTILADYIAGLIPNPQGTCNVNGVNVTWVSGPQFSIYFNGSTNFPTPFVINGVLYTVFAVQSPTKLQLTQAAPAQNGVPWMATIQVGEIFADSQAYVLPTINLGWRKLQKKLTDKGHPRLKQEAIIFNLPVMTNLDPGAEQWINWNFFFDGTEEQDAPVLPPDFISPLRFWERPSIGAPSPTNTNLNRFIPMHPAPDSLRARPKGTWNRKWDWRNDSIYLPGSIVAMDLKTAYSAYLPDIVPAAGGFSSTIVPITRCADSLAYYAAAEFVNPRGGVLATTFEAKGDAGIDQITNQFAKLQQRASFSRRAWGRGGNGRRRSGYGML
jgi:hypothetical protein